MNEARSARVSTPRERLRSSWGGEENERRRENCCFALWGLGIGRE